VEHMMFKGTNKRPSYLDISRILDASGAHYNAFTSKDYTGYYIKIDTRQQELAFDVLSDIVFNSHFNEAEMEKEKGVIVEELRMYDDNPLLKIDSLYEEIMFKNSALARDIGGTVKTVRALKRKDLFSYYQKYYRPDNMILVCAGNINNKKQKQLLSYFEKIKPQTGSLSALRHFEKFNFSKAKIPLKDRILVQTKKTDQAQMILGFPGINNNSPKRFALSVLLSILGGGMSSRLFVEVREKLGLAYMINASAASFCDVGTVFVQAGLNPSRLQEAIAVIVAELKKVVKHGVSDEEIKNAQNNLIGHLALSWEDSSAVASWYAKKFLFSKKLETPEEIIRQLKKVNKKDVQKLAGELFDFSQVRIALISDLKKEKFLKLVKI